MKTLTLAVAIALLFVSCENPFNPQGPYTPRLVVYSVLSNARSTQFVRVSSTHNPSELNPYLEIPDSGLAGADVKIISGGSTFQFRDTLLQVGDSGSRVHAYVCDSLPVNHGVQYLLEVRKDSLELARSAITVPTAPSVLISRDSELSMFYALGKSFRVGVGLSNRTRRHLVRMYVEFDVPEGADTVRHRWEVPLLATDTSLSDAWYSGFEYTQRTSFDVAYSGRAYVSTVAKIIYRYTTLTKFRNIVLEVFQIGEPLEDYSSVVNAFKDELSLRADEPDYSNISGGHGLFGAYTRTEFLRPFPNDFFYDPWLYYFP